VAGNFSLRRQVQTGSGSHPTSTRGSLLASKAAGA